MDEENFLFSPSEVMPVATLLEYMVAAYGYEQLPVLLDSLANHDDWETLIPAVFGVSAADFEANWLNYLAQHYFADSHAAIGHDK